MDNRREFLQNRTIARQKQNETALNSTDTVAHEISVLEDQRKPERDAREKHLNDTTYEYVDALEAYREIGSNILELQALADRETQRYLSALETYHASNHSYVSWVIAQEEVWNASHKCNETLDKYDVLIANSSRWIGVSRKRLNESIIEESVPYKQQLRENVTAEYEKRKSKLRYLTSLVPVQESISSPLPNLGTQTPRQRRGHRGQKAHGPPGHLETDSEG